MSRFAQDTGTLPASLDEAADRLQASIANYTRGVLRGAEARASAISEHATRSAERAAAAATSAHAARMVDAIDLLERRINASFASLREETEALLSEISSTHQRGGRRAPPFSLPTGLSVRAAATPESSC
jgi:molecular chaperone GrpE (heat shock protein)